MTQTAAQGSKTGIAVDRALELADEVSLTWLDPQPEDHAWTMAADALAFMAALVRVLQPRRIVEFGCGMSTEVLAREVAALRDDVAFESFENDPRETAATRSKLERQGLASAALITTVPLVLRHRSGRLVPWYLFDPTRDDRRDPAGLVLVDGPANALGGREGALYQALDLGRAGTVIVLDDADREEEREAVGRIEAQLTDGIRVRRPEGFVRGLAVIEVLGDLEPLLRHEPDTEV